MGLKEIKRKGETILKRKNGNILAYFGETICYKGAGFYICNNISDRILEIKRISERIAVLKIKINQ